jgi:hypothetical protein
VPHVAGPLGNAGWYTGDVTVEWEVVDATILTTSGCEDAAVVSDTVGVTFTCSATSWGGTASASVTVKRDATPPSVTCEPSPAILRPPLGQLVPVEVEVAVTDATSGSAGFVLTAATGGDSPDDIAGFDIGTPDVSGRLRAERPGRGDRRYELVYTGSDTAGNQGTCTASVTVPAGGGPWSGG